jgi:hypothetical protein
VKKLLFLTLLVGALGCDSEENLPKKVNVQLVLLQVDFLTNEFEGGKIFSFDSLLAKDLRDSIPMEFIREWGDYATEVLGFIPTQDTIFFGTRYGLMEEIEFYLLYLIPLTHSQKNLRP